jgi:DNA repair exonuclease SbcCD ATPase subunit
VRSPLRDSFKALAGLVLAVASARIAPSSALSERVLSAATAVAPSSSSSSTDAKGTAASRTNPHKALKSARKALRAGNLIEARRNYEVVIENRPNDADLAEALFGGGMLWLHPYQGSRDVSLGRARLERFEASFPDHECVAGAVVALALQEESAKASEEAERLREELAKQKESCEGEKTEMSKRVEAAEGEAKTHAQDAASQAQKIQQLEADLAESNNALAGLRAKIAEQEKALNEKDKVLSRLKKALVKQRTQTVPRLPK